jgi:hypothetical protein
MSIAFDMAQGPGSGRLKRLPGRSSHHVNKLDDAVAIQNRKNPIV